MTLIRSLTLRGPSVSLLVLVATVGCGAGRQAADGEPASSVAFEGGAIIVRGEALQDGPGSLLAAISGKVPNLRVRHPHASRCPEITLRGNSSIQTVANPHVYVDGTRATDTCILESIRTDDVDRVEVYPQGFTARPGYGTHGPGLILVFMRSAG